MTLAYIPSFFILLFAPWFLWGLITNVIPSVGPTILYVAIFAVIFFSGVRLIVRVQLKNFYFKCDDEKFEVKVGRLYRATSVIPYNLIKKIWAGENFIAGGRSGRGVGIGLYCVSINWNGQVNNYGNFTKEGAQQIVDFINNKITRGTFAPAL